MAGDYTRFRYNPLKDPTGILMEQGKVLMDQDWNENVLVQDRRWRTETTDIIGRAVVPIETPTGFEILIAGANLTIGRGRMYVDGLLAENHGSGPTEFDRVLGEVRGTLATPYDKQPYYPDPPPLPADANPHLVYLDVWEREVTYLEDIDLVDKAVGVDTCTRIQTVWQVKVLSDTPAGTDCSTPSDTLTATAPSAGRLTTAAAGVPASTDPCIVPAGGGYRGSGNRLYRVEIHKGGPLGTAQFKWSRDNASVATAITGINAARNTLHVVLTRRDAVLRFQPNDWVEVTDDVRYFHGLSGEMAQISAVNDVDLTIQLKNPLPAGAFDATKPDRCTRLIRWDQSGIVRDPVGTVIVDVDTNNGLIPVPAAGTTIVLEDGVQVTLSIDAAMPVPSFRPLEHWSFAARVVDASVEILKASPPRGIIHHYGWLAFVTFPAAVTNCRVFWPPDFGKSCDCTVCVTAVSHNKGTLTIQSAINQVKGKGGGKVCLGPGVYNISKTIVISGASAIEISGHGLPSLQATPDLVDLPIMLIERSIDVIVEDLTFAAGMMKGNPSVGGVDLLNTFFVRLLRCAFVFGTDGAIIPNGRTLLPAISLRGGVVDTDIKDNFFNNVKVGIGELRGGSNRLIRALAIESNQMVCAEAGVRLRDPALTLFSEIRFVRNFVQSPFGFFLSGLGLDIDVESNTFSLVVASPGSSAPTQVGVFSNVSQTRIANNQIFGGGETPRSHGIVLGAPGTPMYGTQVTGNRINNLTSHGISIAAGALLLETIIANNQLLNLGHGGIVMLSAGGVTSAAVDLNIWGNSLAFVAQTPDENKLMAAIIVITSINVNIADNSIENLAMDPGFTNSRFGIFSGFISGMRVAGNRIANVGPPGPVSMSAGIAAIFIFHRFDIVDNEVRRSVAPPPAGDFSVCLALELLGTEDGSVRGNLFEGFGRPSMVIVLTGGSLIFSENQVFFDNPVPGPSPIARLQGNPVIASSNYIKGPLSPAGAPALAMSVVSPVHHSVLGNIAIGRITVNAAVLPPATTIPTAGAELNVDV